MGGGQGHLRRASPAEENNPVSGVSTWLTPTPPSPSTPLIGFTTAAYLRIHAVKDHGLQAPRADRILCKLCSVHCKTPAQLAGHMQTHLGGAAPPVPGDAPQPQPTC